jgi:hypothetical protein
MWNFSAEAIFSLKKDRSDEIKLERSASGD